MWKFKFIGYKFRSWFNRADQLHAVVDPEFMASINKLNSLIENGIPAFISFDHLRETTNKVNQIEAEVSK